MVLLLSITMGLVCFGSASALARGTVRRSTRARCTVKRVHGVVVSRRCGKVAARHSRRAPRKRVHRQAARRHAVKTAATRKRLTRTRLRKASSAAFRPLFDGSFACDCIKRSLFPVASFVPGHVSVVPDPLGSGQNVLKFAVANSDRPYVGAENPRADIETPRYFKPGDDDYISVPLLVPADTPSVDPMTSFFELAEIYGPPYGGSPPVGVTISDWGTHGVNHFQMTQDGNHGHKLAWTGPAVDGKWHTVTFHVKFETNDTGSVQIYFDGQLQTLANGSTTLNEATLDPGVNWDGSDGNFLNVQSYRSAGSFPGTMTTYAGTPRIGTTLASVQ